MKKIVERFWIASLLLALCLLSLSALGASAASAQEARQPPDSMFHDETGQGGTAHCDPISLDCWKI